MFCRIRDKCAARFEFFGDKVLDMIANKIAHRVIRLRGTLFHNFYKLALLICWLFFFCRACKSLRKHESNKFVRGLIASVLKKIFCRRDKFLSRDFVQAFDVPPHGKQGNKTYSVSPQKILNRNFGRC